MKNDNTSEQNAPKTAEEILKQFMVIVITDDGDMNTTYHKAKTAQELLPKLIISLDNINQITIEKI